MHNTSVHPFRVHPGRSLLVILGIVALLLSVTVGIAEVYLRLTVPFITTNWPGRFDPRFGDNFIPGEILHWTNGVDFWTRTRANSLGFLDREPPEAPPDSGCRVLFIGDSIVQASQVPIEKKSHVIFETLAREQLPALGVETVALGSTGTGQANQLAYYERFGPGLQPDVVVLVVAGNDLANNSPLLESLRYGWHPGHLPRLFFVVTPDGDHIARQAIDPDWKQYRLSEPYKAQRPAHQYLNEHGYSYNWLYTHIERHLPALAGLISGQSSASYVATRMRDIENLDGFEEAYAEWDYPDDLDMNHMFHAADPLPPVFRQALQLTGHALDEFQHRAQADGFHLLMLAAYNVTRHYAPGTVRMGRSMRDRGAFLRLEELAAARDIPLIDQYGYILEQGGDPGEARFSVDRHWSEQGHVWAAEAVLEYFRHNPQLCSTTGQL
jgi:hypothetical protein